ncbi:hypothetical protein MRB53_042054 [Persea americana]|nr:hypothetical protein MRB53_042054 [Persea americana]
MRILTFRGSDLSNVVPQARLWFNSVTFPTLAMQSQRVGKDREYRGTVRTRRLNGNSCFRDGVVSQSLNEMDVERIYRNDWER